MREEHRIQRALTEPWLDLPYAKELEAIDRPLAEEPEIGSLAAQELTSKRRDRGRRGMTGDEVIRALVLKQMNRHSYAVLHFLLHDSQSAIRSLDLQQLLEPRRHLGLVGEVRDKRRRGGRPPPPSSATDGWCDLAEL
jgi:hypothetical protein